MAHVIASPAQTPLRPLKRQRILRVHTHPWAGISSPYLSSKIQKYSASFPSAATRRCWQRCHAGVLPHCGSDDFDDSSSSSSSKLSPAGSRDSSSPRCASEPLVEQSSPEEGRRSRLEAAAASAIRFLRKWALGVALAVGAMGLHLGSMQAGSLRSRDLIPVSEPIVMAEGSYHAADAESHNADSHSHSALDSARQPSAAASAGERSPQRPFSMQVKYRERTCRAWLVQLLGGLLYYLPPPPFRHTAKDSRDCSLTWSSCCRTMRCRWTAVEPVTRGRPTVLHGCRQQQPLKDHSRLCPGRRLASHQSRRCYPCDASVLITEQTMHSLRIVPLESTTAFDRSVVIESGTASCRAAAASDI